MALSFIVVSEITAWIEKNLCRPLSIDDIALHSGYSKWHLQRLFVHYMGENLATYVRRRKLEEAALDLCCTTARIIEISEKYGFDSQQSFTRAFSKSHKISPHAYRKRKSII